jgi:hypothetical protein
MDMCSSKQKCRTNFLDIFQTADTLDTPQASSDLT